MPHPSWIRSREARLWLRLSPGRAGSVLVGAYAEEAGTEALLRAWLAERDRDRAGARFWLAVYEGVAREPLSRLGKGQG